MSKQSYRLENGRRVERLNVLRAEATCFLTVSNVGQLQLPPLDNYKQLRESIHDDSITFFLVHWFEPHQSSHERDHLHRPICPGPLHINHCVWTYSVTPSARRSVPQDWMYHQRHAYYGLIFPHNVVHRVNITACFIDGSTSTGWDPLVGICDFDLVVKI